MKNTELESMTIEDLWTLHEDVSALLTAKISSEKIELEKRLAQLGQGIQIDASRPSQRNVKKASKRRPYPEVFPKFRNPRDHNEVWAGRGKQPRWLAEQLKLGKKIEDFLIEPIEGRKSAKKRESR